MKIKSKVKLGKQLYCIETDKLIFYFKCMVLKETGLIAPIGPGSGQVGVKAIAGSRIGWENIILMDISDFERSSRVDSVPESFKVLYV
jgi:hypothetical protein